MISPLVVKTTKVEKKKIATIAPPTTPAKIRIKQKAMREKDIGINVAKEEELEEEGPPLV